jgi:hypothetical protein
VVIGGSSDTDGADLPGPGGFLVPWLVLDERDDYRDQTKHPAMARLGRFSTPLPSARGSDLTLDAAATQLRRVQADQLEEFPPGVVKPLLPDLALGSLARAAPGSARPAHGHGRVFAYLAAPTAAGVLAHHRVGPGPPSAVARRVSSGLTELKESDPRVGAGRPGRSTAAAGVVGAASPGVCPAGL